jgi:hypothetical protein
MASIVTKVKRPPVTFDQARDPDAWRKVSQRLLDSARLIWRSHLDRGLTGYASTRAGRTPEQEAAFAADMQHFGAFFVLAGLAVENAIKARLLRNVLASGAVINDLIDLDNAVWIKGSRGHNLVELARRSEARLILSEGERDLLERLARYVKWAGRYPFPNHKNDDLAFRRTTRDRDLQDIERFIARL